MINEHDATWLTLDYARNHYGVMASQLLVNMTTFKSGWLATFERIDGLDLVGGETIVIERGDGKLSTFASGMSQQRIIELMNASKAK